MDEKQAWLFLAEQWDNPSSKWGECYWAGNRGLCGSITELTYKDSICITHELGEIMKKRMRLHGKPFWGFWWPTNREGARQRADFCRKMAAICEGEQV